jgi:hypothetical protein
MLTRYSSASMEALAGGKLTMACKVPKYTKTEIPDWRPDTLRPPFSPLLFGHTDSARTMMIGVGVCPDKAVALERLDEMPYRRAIQNHRVANAPTVTDSCRGRKSKIAYCAPRRTQRTQMLDHLERVFKTCICV